MNLHLNGIWGWLLKPLFELCMLGFAAGGTALGGGEGGGLGLDMGGGGSDGGEEFGGDGEASDEFGDGSEQDGLNAGDTEEDGGTDHREDGRQQQLTPQQRADAAREKALPPGVKKALATVKETDPKTAQILRSAIFATQAWTQVMPGGIRQAREMAKAFEDVGGTDGIQTLRDEAQSLQAELDGVDEKWTAADPQFFATLAENDPDAFVRATPVVLDQLQKTDKPAYNALLGRIFWNTLSAQRVVSTMEQLLHLANANKAAPGMAGLVEGLNGLLSWADSIQQLAMNQPQRTPDKGMEKLKQREKEFENKQFDGFKKEVGRDVKTHLESGIMRDVGKLLKLRNVNLAQLRVKDKDRFESMVAEADRQLTAAIMKDRAFHQQKDRLLQTRDKDRVLRLYQQKINYLLADPSGPRIAKKVADIFYRGAKPGPRPGGGGQNGGQGDRGQQRQRIGGDNGQGGGGNNQVMRVSKSPDGSQIDWSQTTDDDILEGRAVLKTGKKVQWRG